MELDSLFRLAIHTGDIVMDIGAFEGDISLCFSRLTGNTGRVYAFEPHPTRFLELSRKAYQVRNILPYCRAIADFSGHCPIFLAPPVTAKSSTIIPGLGTKERLGPGIDVCLAETQTLDDFVRMTSCRPGFIKVDTEGAEKLVFSGGKRVIETFLPPIVFEGAFGYSRERQAFCNNEPVPSHVAWLESLGYLIFIVDIDYFMDAWVPPDSPAHAAGYGLLSISAAEFQHLPVTGCNLLAVHPAHVLASVIDQRGLTVKALDRLAPFCHRC